MDSGWSTIESDAGVFTELIESLDVKNVEVEELLAIDGIALEHLRPIYGVIFLFRYDPITTNGNVDTNINSNRNGSQPLDGTFDSDCVENGTVWFSHQTIHNACATQAILSILLNNNKEIEIGSELNNFREFSSALDPSTRGDALAGFEKLRSVHNSFSQPIPFVDETLDRRTNSNKKGENVFHYIAYTLINETLYELDGLQPYPISHGSSSKQKFPTDVMEVIKRRVARYPEDEIYFNLLALIKDRRIVVKEIFGENSVEMKEELEKRAKWKKENILRRENFNNLIFQLLKIIISKDNMNDDEWNDLIKKARQISKDKAMNGLH